MAGANLLYSNPNHAHGCHPQRRQCYVESIDSTSPRPSPRPASARRTDCRGITLQKVFRRINRSGYPGKEQLSAWVVHKYRRGCKPVTLSTHCSYIVAFLEFAGQASEIRIRFDRPGGGVDQCSNRLMAHEPRAGIPIGIDAGRK